MITIRTKKIVVRGEQKREIIGIEALERDQLPEKYIQGSPCCESTNRGCLYICGESGFAKIISPHEIYDEPLFQNLLVIVKKASQRLCDINKELAEENKNWHGSETFLI